MSYRRKPRSRGLLTSAIVLAGCGSLVLAPPSGARAGAMPASVRSVRPVHTKHVDRRRHRRHRRHKHHSQHTLVVSASPPASQHLNVASSAVAAATIDSVLAMTCENTELTPTPENLAQVDAATLCLIDQERARNGELPLTPNAQLQQAAQGHSEEMVSDDYFAHVAPSGLTPVGRVQAAGYIPDAQVGYTIGENIAWGTLSLATPSAIVAAWIASPEHLANILDREYVDSGIGVDPAAPASLSEGQPGAVYSQELGVIIE